MRFEKRFVIFAIILINTESYVDRSARRVNRTAWKQSQCIASRQAATSHATTTTTHGSGSSSAFVRFGNQHTLSRPPPTLSNTKQSSISISSGSVSSIASSLATSNATGKSKYLIYLSNVQQGPATNNATDNHGDGVKDSCPQFLDTSPQMSANSTLFLNSKFVICFIVDFSNFYFGNVP